MQLHERISAWIAHSGLSQNHIAEEIGVTRQAVSQWMRGVTEPNIRSLVGLTLTLGVTMDRFWGDVPKKRRA